MSHLSSLLLLLLLLLLMMMLMLMLMLPPLSVLMGLRSAAYLEHLPLRRCMSLLG
jgi:hypothetical protein